MRRLAAIASAAFLAATLAGCIVATGPGHSRHAVRHGHRCHPSHYWDGHKCKHKGKGHGARKHDGEHHHGHGHDD